MAALWSGGLGSASKWLGVARWQSRQFSEDWSGVWQERQWNDRGDPQAPRWLLGSVEAWHSTQKSVWWQVRQASRSIEEATPWSRCRHKLVWLRDRMSGAVSRG